jgi:hypothetical protein
MSEEQRKVLLRLAETARKESDSPSIRALSMAVECLAYSERWFQYDWYMRNEIPFNRWKGIDIDDNL